MWSVRVLEVGEPEEVHHFLEFVGPPIPHPPDCTYASGWACWVDYEAEDPADRTRRRHWRILEPLPLFEEGSDVPMSS